MKLRRNAEILRAQRVNDARSIFEEGTGLCGGPPIRVDSMTMESRAAFRGVTSGVNCDDTA